LLQGALRSARRCGAQTELLDLPSAFNLKHLRGFDGLILATPVHWFNASALMQQFLADLTFAGCADSPWVLEGKAASFIAVCSEDGGQQAISAMMVPLNFMGIVIPPWAGVFQNESMRGGQDKWQRLDVPRLGRRLVRFIESLRGVA